MGNTPSNQASPARNAAAGPSSAHDRQALSSSASPSQPGGSSRNPNLRLPMPQRPTHVSPNSSNPTSPNGGRAGSPRRRKSLELPDLNKLSFTPAAPVTTLATHTSHHLATPQGGHSKRSSTGGAIPSPATQSPSAGHGGGGGGRWRQALGGRVNSPLAGSNALGAMSKIEGSGSVSGPRTAPVSMPNASVSPTRAAEANVNPYFPSSPVDRSPSRRNEESPRRNIQPIAIPGSQAPLLSIPAAASYRKGEPASQTGTGTLPPPTTAAPTPPSRMSREKLEEDDGLVNVPVQWNGGGKNVFVTGNFADNWKGRIRLKKSTHDFNAMLRLPPGQYRLKFIVDDSWRCSKQIPTATDDDGTLVNWLEVEAPKTEEEMKAEWALDAKPSKADDDESLWTSTIPAPLALYQHLEELPMTCAPAEYEDHLSKFPHITSVPLPPTLPRILDKVILNSESRRSWDEPPTSSPGLDDNSILPVPNHVVLNHLTASAIKNGTLGVGTTTRYRKKYITTMYFKPTLGDLMDGAPPPSQAAPESSQSPADTTAATAKGAEYETVT